ncbi:hypothetical protein [Verrucosispora sp. WMMC514]|uniref:hypothetical protein n=1 Tax=Verrucosispora sp. WMMC514 TaxID=3015156 RepID=UPI00248AC48A|nr:hypothetical protein [Verrucosispora sp. WMMC514]WBB94152.1 hypothetical protein O7597_14985 [Verrucosispora sp. WMMC514]
MSLALLGALLLVYVAWRTWRTAFTWYDALITILLGVVIAKAGDGFLYTAFDTAVDWVRAIFDFIAKLFG